jgi:hypothetical protein
MMVAYLTFILSPSQYCLSLFINVAYNGSIKSLGDGHIHRFKTDNKFLFHEGSTIHNFFSVGAVISI